MSDEPQFLGEEQAGELTAPYWRALRAGRLDLQRCLTCDRFQHYPRRFCRWCGGDQLGWATIAGTGTVFVSTVAVRLRNQPATGPTPATLAIVRLDEGPLILTRADSALSGRQLRGTRVRIDHDATARTGLPTATLADPPTEGN